MLHPISVVELTATCVSSDMHQDSIFNNLFKRRGTVVKVKHKVIRSFSGNFGVFAKTQKDWEILLTLVGEEAI